MASVKLRHPLMPWILKDYKYTPRSERKPTTNSKILIKRIIKTLKDTKPKKKNKQSKED